MLPNVDMALKRMGSNGSREKTVVLVGGDKKILGYP
jgi:hypothetical protein